jgi:hypothetical protein
MRPTSPVAHAPLRQGRTRAKARYSSMRQKRAWAERVGTRLRSKLVAALQIHDRTAGDANLHTTLRPANANRNALKPPREQPCAAVPRKDMHCVRRVVRGVSDRATGRACMCGRACVGVPGTEGQGGGNSLQADDGQGRWGGTISPLSSSFSTAETEPLTAAGTCSQRAKHASERHSLHLSPALSRFPAMSPARRLLPRVPAVDFMHQPAGQNIQSQWPLACAKTRPVPRRPEVQRGSPP